MRALVFCLAILGLLAPAAAQQSQEVAQLRLYIQQLEERLRQLTGQNEQLLYQLNQLQAATGQAPAASGESGNLAPGSSQAVAGAQNPFDPSLLAPAQDGAPDSVARDDPLIAPDGVETDAPADLSTMAGGYPTGAGANGVTAPLPQPGLPGQTQTAALPGTPASAALSGSARDEYDLAYGYILTGDYGLAEQSFQNWLAAFPDDPQAPDARFWLGESHYQQGEYREAANEFLAVYKAAPDTPKGPDALLKLGVSLSALGEKNAACATLAEVGRKYPQASPALMSRVDDEKSRAGC
jgi:tol-pal system protein YbgF